MHNKVNKHSALNYRPISLTCGFSRTFEHIVTISTLINFSYNNLITNNQFGFVPIRSSNIQLLTCLHSWKASRLKNEYIKVVYIDIKNLSIQYHIYYYLKIDSV